jgi:transketolase
MVLDMVIEYLQIDIAKVGKQVVDFYKQKGGPVVSPLVKAFHL